MTEVVIFLSFRKSKETKWRSRTPLETLISIKIFDNSHLKFGKRKLAKVKKNIFEGPLIVNETFSQIEFVICKSSFAHVMHSN